MIIELRNGYKVDLKDYSSETTVKSAKIQSIATKIFDLSKTLSSSFLHATTKTLGNAKNSFKYIVLGYEGPQLGYRRPENLYFLAFKIAFWIFGMGVGTVMMTGRLFLEKLNQNPHLFLKNHVGDEIDVQHFKSLDLELDSSSVPSNVVVDDLLKIFDEINFTDANKPGYMPPSTRKDPVEISVDILKKQLELYVSRVNGRVPFSYTPPAYDILGLNQFYQQIENAVRLSIHKTNQNLKTFINKHNFDVKKYDTYIDQLKNEYQDLLQERARLALDLAIAGRYCGTRYMGQSMNSYYLMYGERSIDDRNLQDSLITILAQERNQIAQAQIAEHLPRDVHGNGRYMSSLGGILGLPASKNFIEVMNESFPQNEMLALFFEQYHVDRIITTVQEKIKKSHYLRTKVLDWIKDQVKNWKEAEFLEQKQQCQEEVRQILAKTPDISEFYKKLNLFKEFVGKVKSESLPKFEGDWDEEVVELFAIKEGKDWLRALPEFQNAQKSKLINEFQSLFKKDNLTPEIIEVLKAFIIEKKEFKNEDFGQAIRKKQTIQKINKIFRFEDHSTIERIIDGKVSLEVVVHDYMLQNHRNEFIESLFTDKKNANAENTLVLREEDVKTETNTDEPSAVEKIATEGFSKEIIEWVLVSQKILLPQEMKNERQ